jgi:glyoxylase-like metal-dependent hydrolase (beta-lactamase superfamily II)
MRLSKRVYIVGSGANGFYLSHRNDCTVYAIDCGGPIVLVDAGVGVDTDAILENMHFDGLQPERVTHLLLTHKHADHSGGCASLHNSLGLSVVATEHTGDVLARGDEEAISLPMSKRAGIYDADLPVHACPVEKRLKDGDTLQVGDVMFTMLETPGHCAGHAAFLFTDEGKLHLLGGDNIFQGGRILLQNIPDCDLQQHLATVRRLAALPVDVFLPGHTMPCLKEGYRHLQAAAARLDRMLAPESYL